MRESMSIVKSQDFHRLRNCNCGHAEGYDSKILSRSLSADATTEIENFVPASVWDYLYTLTIQVDGANTEMVELRWQPEPVNVTIGENSDISVVSG